MPFSSPTANDIPNKTARALPPGVKPNRNRQNLSAALPRAQSISPGSKAAFFSFTEGIAPRLAGKGDHVRAQKRCRPRFPRAAEVLRPASGQRQPFRSGSGSLFNPPFPRKKKKKNNKQTNLLSGESRSSGPGGTHGSTVQRGPSPWDAAGLSPLTPAPLPAGPTLRGRRGRGRAGARWLLLLLLFLGTGSGTGAAPLLRFPPSPGITPRRSRARAAHGTARLAVTRLLPPSPPARPPARS